MRFVRHMVKENLIKAPEKCGKKFMKYCDRNSDNYITVEELLVCTEVRKKAKREQRKRKLCVAFRKVSIFMRELEKGFIISCI